MWVHEETTLLPFIQGRLDRSRAKAEGLPFEFCGGFVGYLGYEMKEECYDMRGGINQ